MRTCFIVAVVSVSVLSAQSPNLTGVWKADPAKSKVNGPAPTNYLVIIDQQGSTISEKIGITGPRGEQRSSFTYNTDGKPSMNSRGGAPMRSTASWEGTTLVVDSKVAGPRPATIKEKYTLSPDGKTLTVDTVMTANGKDTPQLVVLEKQSDAAGEALRKPEQAAGERFKNIQVMKEVPASQFLDAMRYFTVALGTDCEHCHVQGKFDADDKPAKAMARKMITMNHSINQETFAGKMVVRCYTCHQGHIEPQNAPAF